MTDYTNSFGGAAKDAADAPNNATDLDTEFNNIATMSSTKADKVAGLTSSGIIPKLDISGNLTSSGTKTGHLGGFDADSVDGYDAGNSSGQVAVSNGQVCVNLNASYLQGKTTGSGLNSIPVSDNGFNEYLNAGMVGSYTKYPLLYGLDNAPASVHSGSVLSRSTNIVHSANTTLYAGIIYCDTFTVNSGVTINLDRILDGSTFLTGLLVIKARTSITIAGTIDGKGKGGKGGAGAVGNGDGVAGTVGYGGCGGDGGDGSPYFGGAGGGIELATINPFALLSQGVSTSVWGGGGGGGAGLTITGTPHTGGAGGDGGFGVILIAPTVTLTGSNWDLRGNAGASAAGAGQGGGGGGGGVLWVQTSNYNHLNSFTASGGAGGAGYANSGVAGEAGYYQVEIY